MRACQQRPMASLPGWPLRLGSFIDRVQGLRGRRRLAIAAFAGAGSALGFAPLNFWPLWFAALPVLAWLLDAARNERPRSAFVVGWAFGFGQFLVGMHWIGYPFVVDMDRQCSREHNARSRMASRHGRGPENALLRPL